MTLSVEPDAGGAIVLVADLGSFDDAYNVDSEPGNGDPCEDDHAELPPVTGASDAAPPDAGPGACPAPPDAEPEPKPSRPDAGTGAGAGDAAAGSDRMGGARPRAMGPARPPRIAADRSGRAGERIADRQSGRGAPRRSTPVRSRRAPRLRRACWRRPFSSRSPAPRRKRRAGPLTPSITESTTPLASFDADGATIDLLGIDALSSLERGEAYAITLYWRVRTLFPENPAPENRWKVFVHGDGFLPHLYSGEPKARLNADHSVNTIAVGLKFLSAKTIAVGLK